MPLIPLFWVGLSGLTLGGVGGFALSDGMKRVANILIFLSIAYAAYRLGVL